MIKVHQNTNSLNISETFLVRARLDAFVVAIVASFLQESKDWVEGH